LWRLSRALSEFGELTHIKTELYDRVLRATAALYVYYAAYV
jgi:hypothetical protein